MPQKVTAVLFDFGGVLTDDPFRSMSTAAEHYGVDPGEFADLVMGRASYAVGSHPWHQLERGEIELADYDRAVDTLMRERGYPGFPGLPVEGITTHTFTLRSEMLDLLDDLRSSALRTGIVSNNVKPLGGWRTLADWDALVDVVIDSSEVGMRKPDPDIFLHACERLDVAPTETVFLDDMDMNIAGAEAVGMTGVHVVDPQTAIATVRSLIA